jgi:hypothetical protein
VYLVVDVYRTIERALRARRPALLVTLVLSVLALVFGFTLIARGLLALPR